LTANEGATAGSFKAHKQSNKILYSGFCIDK